MKLLKTVCLIIAMSTPAHAETIEVPYDKTFHDFPLSWKNGAKYDGKISLRSINEKIYLCGVGHLRGHTAYINNQVLSAMSIEMDGKKIIQNFSFFKYLNTPQELATSKAKCKATNISNIPKGADFKIKQGTTRAYN